MSHPSFLRAFRARFEGSAFQALTLVVAGFLVGGDAALLAQQAPATPAPGAATGTAPAAEGDKDSAQLSPEALEALVAPIALYPDDLLAQCLVASTYPVEVIQAQQWLEKNSTLKGDALSQAAMKQDWDPSIQALVSIPDALKMLAQDVKWTTDLGNAFLAQQAAVMDAIQRMRGKAKGNGKLDSNEQMKVETKTVESKETIIIQQANPEVIVVPSYSPTVVYPPPPAYYPPYPPLYYPPYYPGAAFMSFGIGVAIGVGISGGWGCGWGGGNNTININNNNSYNRNSNRTSNTNRSGNSNWSHDSGRRGGTPYGDKGTAGKYGGQSRGESRQGGGQGRGGASPSASSRGGDAGGRGGGGASPSASSRGGAGGGGASARSSDFSGGSRSGGAGGGDRAGSRSTSSAGGGGGFSGSGGGSRGASATSSRGSSSFSGGSRGGGGGRGGGGRR